MAASSAAAATTLQSLVYESGGEGDGESSPTTTTLRLRVLDQLLLPDESRYIDVTDIVSTWKVIRDMNVRGEWLLFDSAMRRG